MLVMIGRNPVIEVNTISEASKVWLEYEEYEARAGRGGSRAMPHVKLYTNEYVCIGRISYNGRVWGLNGQEMLTP